MKNRMKKNEKKAYRERERERGIRAWRESNDVNFQKQHN